VTQSINVAEVLAAEREQADLDVGVLKAEYVRLLRKAGRTEADEQALAAICKRLGLDAEQREADAALVAEIAKLTAWAEGGQAAEDAVAEHEGKLAAALDAFYSAQQQVGAAQIALEKAYNRRRMAFHGGLGLEQIFGVRPDLFDGRQPTFPTVPRALTLAGRKVDMARGVLPALRGRW